MTGGTLVVSRATELYSFYREWLSNFGFDKITITGAGNDGLKMLIREMKPRIVLICSMFCKGSTPYMIGDLHKHFPKLNIAAISVNEFPDDLAMYFIINGARSYFNIYDGLEQFYSGMNEILEGREFISSKVQKRIDLRSYIEPTGYITEKQKEVLRLAVNGFKRDELANTLCISGRSVDNRKSELYRALNVRNENELLIAAVNLKILSFDELIFFPDKYVLKPLPEKKEIIRRKK